MRCADSDGTEIIVMVCVLYKLGSMGLSVLGEIDMTSTGREAMGCDRWGVSMVGSLILTRLGAHGEV